jgi:hypothetical protein
MRRRSTNKVAAHLCRGQLAAETRIDSWTPPPTAREPRHPLGALPGHDGSTGAAHWASHRCHGRAPLPSLRPIGRLPAPMGGGEGRIRRSEFASGELPGSPYPWGIRRARESTKTREWGGVGGFLETPRPRKAPAARLRPGSRGPPDAKGFGGLTRLPSGSRDSKSLAQVIFRIPPGSRHIRTSSRDRQLKV